MMKLFKRFRNDRPAEEPAAAGTAQIAEERDEPAETPPQAAPDDKPTPQDDFVEWRRSKVRGGIERRERNDIYEAYNVYGTDAEGKLICRRYHRYPEHERDFGLSYSRELSFDDFNRRLLSELDSGGLGLADYRAVIEEAERLADPGADAGDGCEGFGEEQEAALRAFCDSADILKDRSYLHSEGVLSCECVSAVGDERLMLRFRRPLPHDALDDDVAGVKRESKGGYDIDNLWIMGVYNRLRERCASAAVWRLTSEWSVEKESLWLIRAEGFEGVGGALLIAVGEAGSFRRFGFYSLDFSNK